MKLLIITQKIDKNDDVLGFMHSWVGEFAKHCEQVTAIGLGVGEHQLPANVHVLTLGKETGPSRVKYLWNFYRHIFAERKNYDAVFVHMNPEYLVLGGWFWKLLGKKIGLWYTHRSVTAALRVGVWFADIAFTASPESFHLVTPKLHVMGHGIDLQRWSALARENEEGVFRILSVGRISPAKRYDDLIDAMTTMEGEPRVFTTIVGGPATASDGEYFAQLKKKVLASGIEKNIIFAGSVPHNAIDEYLARADLFVNMSTTGSADKAVLEAMAARIPVITSNVGLASSLGAEAEQLMFPTGDIAALKNKILMIANMSRDEREALGTRLAKLVTEKHSLEKLIPRIVAEYVSL